MCQKYANLATFKITVGEIRAETRDHPGSCMAQTVRGL